MTEHVWDPREQELFDRLVAYYTAYYRDALGLPDWQERVMSRVEVGAYNSLGLTGPQDQRDLFLCLLALAETETEREVARAGLAEGNRLCVLRDRTLARPSETRPVRPWWKCWR